MAYTRGLVVLWGGEFAARVAESLFQIALLWYLLEVTGSSAVTGLVTMVSYLPAIVVGLWAGVLVDRWPLPAVLLGAEGVRTALALALPLLFLAGALPVWAVGLLAFLLNGAAAFFNPARDALIPRLAGPGGLVAANSLVQSAWQFSLLLGPFLAAVALQWVPTAHLFFGVALAFALSGAVLLPLPALARAAPQTPAGPALPFGAALRAGLAALLRDRRVFWLWVVTLVNNFFLMGPVIVGMPVYVREHLGASGSVFAVVEGTYAGGMIVATWVVSRYGERRDPVRMLFWALIYDGLTYVPLLWVTGVPGTLATVLVHAFGIPAITIFRLTALHRMVPREVQGRVFAAFHLAVAGMMALSIGTTGAVLAWLPVNRLFAVIGLLCAATGVAGHLLPAFRERPGGTG